MATRPNPHQRERFREFLVPISSALADSVQRIQQITTEHDNGIFQRSAGLIEDMMMVDRINGVINARISGVMAAPMKFFANDDEKKSVDAAMELGGGDDAFGIWREMFTTPAMRELYKWGFMLGVGVAEIVWDRTPDRWTPRLVPYHPHFVQWDWGKRRFILQTETGQVDLPRVDEDPMGDGKWFVWTPYGYNRGWRSSTVRSLAMLYLARNWNFRDWARYGEKHGMAILMGKVPQSAEAKEKEEFFTDMSNIANEAAIMAPQGDDGAASFGLELIEAKSRTWETFDAFKKTLDIDIAIAVLGQNLSTEVSSGSFAAAKVQNLVRQDIATFDAEIWPAIRQQVLSWWSIFNFGNVDHAPRPESQIEPPADEKIEAESLSAFATAILQLQAAGIEVESVVEARGLELVGGELVRPPGKEGPSEVQPGDEPEVDENGDPIEAPPTDEPDPGMDIDTGISIELTPSAQAAIVKVNEARGAIGLGPLTNADGSPNPDGNLSILEFEEKLKADAEVRKRELLPPEEGTDEPPPADGNAETGTLKSPALVIRKGKQKSILKRYTFQEMPISIENIAGTVRRWFDVDGKETGSTTMLADYGFIEGVLSGDAEELDVYVGGDETADQVHIVHQSKAPKFKAFDEDKVMVGFASADSARRMFIMHRNDGARCILGITSMPLSRFLAKLKRRKPTTTRRITAKAGGPYKKPDPDALINPSSVVVTTIRKIGDKYFVFSEDGKRRLGGPFDTREQAQKRLDEIERIKRIDDPDERKEAALALLSKGTAIATLRAPVKNVAGPRNVATYAESLERQGNRRAREAMAPNLRDLMKEIDKAKDWPDLRRRLLKTFKNMDPKKLADVVEKTRIMANMSGRFSGLEDV